MKAIETILLDALWEDLDQEYFKEAVGQLEKSSNIDISIRAANLSALIENKKRKLTTNEYDTTEY